MKLSEMLGVRVYEDENLTRSSVYAHENVLVMVGFGIEVSFSCASPELARALASIRLRDKEEHPAREIDYRLYLARITSRSPWERINDLEGLAAREMYKVEIRVRD